MMRIIPPEWYTLLEAKNERRDARNLLWKIRPGPARGDK
jgi:hypothetical protein